MQMSVGFIIGIIIAGTVLALGGFSFLAPARAHAESLTNEWISKIPGFEKYDLKTSQGQLNAYADLLDRCTESLSQSPSVNQCYCRVPTFSNKDQTGIVFNRRGTKTEMQVWEIDNDQPRGEVFKTDAYPCHATEEESINSLTLSPHLFYIPYFDDAWYNRIIGGTGQILVRLHRPFEGPLQEGQDERLIDNQENSRTRLSQTYIPSPVVMQKIGNGDLIGFCFITPESNINEVAEC